MQTLVRRAFAALLLLSLSFACSAQTAPIRITADLTEAPRKVYHAEIDIPVKPGLVTLTTPQWIPGTHRPTPLVDSITGVVFTAEVSGAKQTLVWRRDDINMYEYHVTVPQGVTGLHAHLDLINPGRQTTKLASLEWEGLLLYPSGVPVSKIAVEPSVKVLTGWGVGTALTPAGSPEATSGGDLHHFAATTVEQLEDSPVDTGLYYKQYALAPEIKPAHFLDVVADEADDVNIRPATLAEINNLIREADAMYKSHHYNEYHLLLTLTDATGGMGLEHGQSSDNGINEKGFSSDEQQLGNSDLLAHEFTHSWNGKYRRPARLYQPDFATPSRAICFGSTRV